MDPMTTHLLKPVVAVEKDLPAALVTLPAGATVQYQPGGNALGLVEVRCGEKTYCVNLQDLLDASSVTDAARVTWPD